jgi:type IV secretion system protein VirB11
MGTRLNRRRRAVMADLLSLPAAEEAQGRRRQMLRTAFGPTIAAALADPTVIEVMVNPDGRLWIERATVGRQDTGERIGSAEAERIIRLVAAHVRREVHDKAPIVSAELPESGELFEGVMPPVAPTPCFAVRKPADVLYRLADYVTARIMSPRQAQVLAASVRDRKNILVVGGTSSGKTTLVNALLAEIADLGERVVILEDTRELKCAAADCVSLRTKPGVATLADLVHSTLRLRPDRIIVGEVRGPEALDMLKAWNTGHPGGVTTVHANSAEAGLYRLEQLVQEAVVTVPRDLIVQAIDIVVFLEGRGANRRVETVLELDSLDDNGDYLLKPLGRPTLHTV